MPSRDLTGSSLLAVFAHPDDESVAAGGLLARCAEAGVHVSLLCLTHGEHGPGGAIEQLRDTRANELVAAARVLGIRDLVLLDHEDGMLPWIDEHVLDSDILDAIRRFRPDVVVTFDADGLYWHPDHIAVHERTTSVVAGIGPSGPALFYASIPAGMMRAVVEAASDHSGSILGVSDIDAFGSMAPAPTLVVHSAHLAGRKLAALRCHQSQVAGTALDSIGEDEGARLLSTEHYRRAEVGLVGDVFLERLAAPPHG